MFNFWGIRKKILFMVLTPTILVSSLMSAYFVTHRIDSLGSAHMGKGKSLLTSLSLIIEASTSQDLSQISQQLSSFRDSDPDILAIAVIDQNNQILVKAGNDSFIDALVAPRSPEQVEQSIFDDSIRMVSEVRGVNTTENAYLSVILNRQPLILESYNTLFMALIISLGILGLSIYFAHYLSRTIGMPLQKMAEELNSINNGNLDTKLHTPDIAELASISKTINSLATSLQQAQENMQQNVEQATSDLTQTLETIEIQNIELDMARKQAIQASRVKSEFLANISHEIRTPMNGVIGFTNLLLNSKIDMTQRDYLITIRKSANNLLSIIEDILDFSKIEAGKMSLEKMTFSLRDCVEEVISILSPSSIKKNIELIPLIYRNVPETILGDPVRVKQILTNLVSNAIKFTEKGSIVVRILLEEEDEHTIVIRSTITDTGIGMTDEQITKLFQPFSQVNQKINRHHSGTGLGLVICKKLVEQMGGEISVESKSNEGTSFSFTLRTEKLSERKQQPKALVSLPEQPVLIFDSHPMALLAMKQLLASWDMPIYDYQTIDKLQTAIDMMAKNKSFTPVIILGTSEHNEYFCNLISQLANYKNKGIYVIGNPIEQQEIDKLIAAGACNYLEKPLTRKQLRKSFESTGLISTRKIKKPSAKARYKQFSKLRILAVDDNPANLKLLTIVLEEMSIDVIQAYDGLSAIEICKEEKFDMIFMDIRMPGLDGIETSVRIRKEGLNQRTPIIALTAHAMAGEKEILLSQGLEDYVTKPVSTSQLENIISKWTGQIAKSTDATIDKRDETKPDLDTVEAIDWEACLNISGGREKLAREMLADLTAAIPKFLEQIADSQMDNETLLANVHKLHGLACYTGVPRVQSIVATFEKRLKEGVAATEIQPLQTRLSEALREVEKDAATYLSK